MYDSSGKDLLGRHETKEDAEEQEQAIKVQASIKKALRMLGGSAMNEIGNHEEHVMNAMREIIDTFSSQFSEVEYVIKNIDMLDPNIIERKLGDFLDTELKRDLEGLYLLVYELYHSILFPGER